MSRETNLGGREKPGGGLEGGGGGALSRLLALALRLRVTAVRVRGVRGVAARVGVRI